MIGSRRDGGRGMAWWMALALLVVLPLFTTGCRKKTPEQKLQEAVDLIEQRQPARGVIKLKEIVLDTPEDPAAMEARLYLARYYASEGNAPKALENLEEVYESVDFTDQRAQAALDGLVDIRWQLQDYEKVLELLSGAIEKAGEENPELYYSRLIDKANALISWGNAEDLPQRVDEGIEILRQIMGTEDSGAFRHNARDSLAVYYRRQEDFEASSNVYRDFMEQYPDDPVRPHLEMMIAVNLHNMGKDEEAQELFAQAEAKKMEDVEAELNKRRRAEILRELAMYHAWMEDYEGAEELMLQIMGENPLSRLAIDTQFQIAQMWVNAGDFDRAIEILEQIKRENPGSNIEMTAQTRIEEVKQIQAAAEAPGEMEPDMEAAPPARTDAAPENPAPESGGTENEADSADSADSTGSADPGTPSE